MKISLSLLAVATVVAIIISSCSSYRDAYITQTNDEGKIVMEEAGGATTPERHLDIQTKQEEVITLEELERQQRAAVKKKDLMLADSLQDLIDRKKHPNRYSGGYTGSNNYYSNSGQYRQRTATNTKMVKLGMINNSKDDVKILNGPFAGMTLNAGKETSKALPWPSGTFLLEYEVYPIGGSWSYHKKINVSIPEDRTTPISFY